MRVKINHTAAVWIVPPFEEVIVVTSKVPQSRTFAFLVSEADVTARPTSAIIQLHFEFIYQQR